MFYLNLNYLFFFLVFLKFSGQILENHHSAVTFKLVHDKRFNIFANLPDVTYRSIRKMVISNILYTDMKRHFESLNTFNVKQQEFMENPDQLCKIFIFFYFFLEKKFYFLKKNIFFLKKK